jgi:hypothetical protein
MQEWAVLFDAAGAYHERDCRAWNHWSNSKPGFGSSRYSSRIWWS